MKRQEAKVIPDVDWTRRGRTFVSPSDLTGKRTTRPDNLEHKRLHQPDAQKPMMADGAGRRRGAMTKGEVSEVPRDPTRENV